MYRESIKMSLGRGQLRPWKEWEGGSINDLLYFRIALGAFFMIGNRNSSPKLLEVYHK